MLKKVLIILAVIIGLILVVGLLLPTTYHVERSRVVAAPPEALYAVVNDFKQWPKWDPWAGKDATMKYTYEGSPTGVGSVQHFTSESGEGTIRIIESEPGRKVKMEMDFKMGEDKLPTATYTFEPIGDGKTKVTWSMDGEGSKPFGGYFGLMMDGMIGPDFERGLENLDKAVTSAPAAAAPAAAPAAVEPAVEPAAVEPAAAPAEDAPAEAAPAEAAPAEAE
ncbi:MAG: SRPBCC family protein [bacterium]|nr:SRPBCC family protein [Myxococcales bacterium]